MVTFAPSPHTSTADAACCPRCGSDEAGERARRRARQLEQLATTAHDATRLASAFAAQAHGEMGAAHVARKLGEPGASVPEGAGWISMRAADCAARMQRRTILMECRVEAGTLGAAPAPRAGAAMVPVRVPAAAGSAELAGMGALAGLMQGKLGGIEKRAGGRGAGVSEERLDAPEPEETLDDEFDDELEDEPGESLDEDPEEDFMTGLCRVFSSETEMAKYSARDLASMRTYLPEAWKPGDPVPPPPPMRAMTPEELAYVEAAYAGPAARKAAAGGVAQGTDVPAAASAARTQPEGPTRPPWRPPKN